MTSPTLGATSSLVLSRQDHYSALSLRYAGMDYWGLLLRITPHSLPSTRRQDILMGATYTALMRLRTEHGEVMESETKAMSRPPF